MEQIGKGKNIFVEFDALNQSKPAEGKTLDDGMNVEKNPVPEKKPQEEQTHS